MIVQMPTKTQAAKVAKLTGGLVLCDDQGNPMSKVKLDDFEVHREAIEAISVLFRLFDDHGTEVPSGWMVTGAAFEVEWPKEPERQLLIWSHFGARRFAKNWAIGQVKADLDARKENPHHVQVPWTLETLRKRWNQVKDEVAPWWAGNSKECYSAGIADAVQALRNWSASKHGTRKGKQVGFPRFESKKRAKNRVRFTTGPKLAKHLTCEACHVVVNRDHNAAKNLRDWPEYNASPGPVGASALFDLGPPEGGTDGRFDGRMTGHRTRRRKTNLVLAAVGEARTKARRKRAEEPRKGCI